MNYSMRFCYFSIFLFVSSLGNASDFCNGLAQHMCDNRGAPDVTGSVNNLGESIDRLIVKVEKNETLNAELDQFIQKESGLMTRLQVEIEALLSSHGAIQKLTRAELRETVRSLVLSECDGGLNFKMPDRLFQALLSSKDARPTSFSDRKFGQFSQRFCEKVFEVTGVNESHRKMENHILPTMKNLMVQKINRLNLPAELKTRARSLINSVKYRKGCQRIDIIRPQFSPTSNSIQMCNGIALANKSEYNQAFIIAHELAHSIDPCRFPELQETEYFKNVAACLRSDKSSGAKDSGAECNQDQLREVFCDWMATEVMASYMNISNKLHSSDQYRRATGNFLAEAPSQSLFCNPKPGAKSIENATHSSFERRINSIISVHPTIRERTGCSDTHSVYRYCNGLDQQPMDNPGLDEQSAESRGTR